MLKVALLYGSPAARNKAFKQDCNHYAGDEEVFCHNNGSGKYIVIGDFEFRYIFASTPDRARGQKFYDVIVKDIYVDDATEQAFRQRIDKTEERIVQ